MKPIKPIRFDKGLEPEPNLWDQALMMARTVEEIEAVSEAKTIQELEALVEAFTSKYGEG